LKMAGAFCIFRSCDTEIGPEGLHELLTIVSRISMDRLLSDKS
jgi:hypothetical protein